MAHMLLEPDREGNNYVSGIFFSGPIRTWKELVSLAGECRLQGHVQ